MRILVAPDSFKMTIDAISAARVIADAARVVFPKARVDECPMADGGEGTLAIWARATGARVESIPACDVFGDAVSCPVATDPVSGDLLVEAAHTCRLPPAALRNPDRSLSFGLGMVLREVLARDPGARLRIALGGTGTLDGGLGAAMALGMRLEDSRGPQRPAGLPELPGEFRISFRNPFRSPPVFLCDTRTRLLGPSGAVPVFGPQKGLEASRFAHYQEALQRLMQAAAEASGRPYYDAEGHGAAGGIAALFSMLCSSTCTSGAEYVFKVLHFEQRTSLADLVVTGEGCLDETSFSGKIVGEIASLCETARKPLLVLAGRSRLGPEGLPPHLVVRTAAAASEADPEEKLAKALLYDAAHSAFRDISKKQLFPSVRF